MVAWAERDATLLSASWISERILLAQYAEEGSLRANHARNLLAPAAQAIEALDPAALEALSHALSELAANALTELAKVRQDYAASIQQARRDAASPAVALGAGDAWRPMALAGAIVVLLTVATTEVKVRWDSASQSVTTEIHKHPGVPDGIAAIVATIAGVVAGTSRGSGTAPTPPAPPSVPSPPTPPQSPASGKAQGATGDGKVLPAPPQIGERPNNLHRDDAEALRARVQDFAEKDGWLDPGRWKKGRAPKASRHPATAKPDHEGLPSTLGFGLIQDPQAGTNATRFRVAVRIGTERIMDGHEIARLRKSLDRLFGEAVSIRSTTPALALSGTARPGPTKRLLIGASIAARSGGVGAVSLLLKDPNTTDLLALSAGHVFLDRNRAELLGRPVHSPAQMEEDTRESIGLVRHISLFPTRDNHVPPGGDLALVKILDPSFVPEPSRRLIFDDRQISSRFYPFDPEQAPPNLSVVKASASTPFARATLTSVDLALKYFYPMTGQMFEAQGLLEITLADSEHKRAFRLAPGDSGALVCVEEGGHHPLGMILAGAVLAPPARHENARMARDWVVGYVQTFHDNIHLQGLEIL